MEFLYLLIVVVVAYVLVDRGLLAVENYLGRRFAQRQVIFFGALLVVLMTAFAVIRNLAE